jgi:hypothetical protein
LALPAMAVMWWIPNTLFSIVMFVYFFCLLQQHRAALVIQI